MEELRWPRLEKVESAYDRTEWKGWFPDGGISVRYKNPWMALHGPDGATSLFMKQGKNKDFRKHGACTLLAVAYQGNQEVLVVPDGEFVYLLDRTAIGNVDLKDADAHRLRIACKAPSVQKMSLVEYRNYRGAGSSGHPPETNGAGESDQHPETNDHVPDDLAFEVEHERRFSEIIVRRGQPKFRDDLIAAYGKCAISGCDAVEALEAAHITPYCESLDNQLSNGLLLRADIHTLFDLHLIGIDPQSLTIALSPALLATTYKDLHGKRLSPPVDNVVCPSQPKLAARWKVFLDQRERA